MKINVRIRDEWLLIPCKTSECTVEWLGNEALHRYRGLKGYIKNNDQVQEIRKSQGGSLLFPDDPVEDVLDDNDFIYVGKSKTLQINYYYFSKLLKLIRQRKINSCSETGSAQPHLMG